VITIERTDAPSSEDDAPFGLSRRALDLLRGVFSGYPAVERAIVYGSRAKGNFRNGSDIDIALEGSALRFDDLLRIETVLDDLMLPWGIDLSLLSHIDNPALLDHIARVGKTLRVRENAHSGTSQ
jgi:predicted nucleotidyltransferase